MASHGFYSEIYDDIARALRSESATKAEVAFIDSTLQHYGCRRVLDGGCGAGRVAIPLSHRGYEVVGVDRSEELLAIAAELVDRQDANVRFTHGSLDRYLAEAGMEFDAILLWNTTLGEAGLENAAAIIQNLRRSLRSPGLIIVEQLAIFSVARHANDDGTSRFEVRSEGGQLLCVDEVKFEPSTQALSTIRYYTGSSRAEPDELRVVLFSPEQFAAELLRCGALEVDVLGANGESLSLDSPSIVWVARFE